MVFTFGLALLILGTTGALAAFGGKPGSEARGHLRLGSLPDVGWRSLACRRR